MRIKLKQTALFAIFVVLLIAGCSKQLQHPAGSDFAEGMAKLELHDFEAAKSAFQAAGENNQTRPVGWLGMAYLAERQMKYIEALNHFMVVADADSTFPEAFVGVCRIMSWMGWHDNQLEEASRASNRFPDNIEIKLTLIKALMESGLHGRAISIIANLRELGLKESVADMILARVFWNDGNIDSTNYYLERAGNDADADFYTSKADYFEDAGLVDSALIYGEKAITSTGGSVAKRMEQFHRSLRLQAFTSARSVIVDMDKLNCGETVSLGLNIHYSLAVDDRPALKSLATEYKLKAGDCASSAYYEMIARGLMAQSMAVSQERALMETIMTRGDYNPRCQGLMNFVTVNFFALLDYEFATIDELKGINRAYVNRVETRINLASLYYKTGQYELGENEFKFLLKQYTKSPNRLIALGDMLAQRNWHDTSKAIELYEMAITADQLNKSALRKLVEIKRVRGKYDEALTLFETYPEAANLTNRMQILKSIVMVESGDVDKGFELFKENWSYCSQVADDFTDLLKSLDHQGNLVAARELCNICSEIGSANTDALLSAFDFLITIDENELANKAITSAVTIEPNLLAVTTRSNFMSYLEGDFETAFAGLEKDLTVDENNQDANYFMSQMLSREQKDPDRATNLARRATFGSFMSYRNWMNLSFAYYQMGRFDLCRGESIKASHKFTNHPLPHYFIGMALYQEGNPEFEDQLALAMNKGLRGKELAIANKALAETR